MKTLEEIATSPSRLWRKEIRGRMYGWEISEIRAACQILKSRKKVDKLLDIVLEYDPRLLSYESRDTSIQAIGIEYGTSKWVDQCQDYSLLFRYGHVQKALECFGRTSRGFYTSSNTASSDICLLAHILDKECKEKGRTLTSQEKMYISSSLFMFQNLLCIPIQ